VKRHQLIIIKIHNCNTFSPTNGFSEVTTLISGRIILYDSTMSGHSLPLDADAAW